MGLSFPVYLLGLVHVHFLVLACVDVALPQVGLHLAHGERLALVAFHDDDFPFRNSFGEFLQSTLLTWSEVLCYLGSILPAVFGGPVPGCPLDEILPSSQYHFLPRCLGFEMDQPKEL